MATDEKDPTDGNPTDGNPTDGNPTDGNPADDLSEVLADLHFCPQCLEANGLNGYNKDRVSREYDRLVRRIRRSGSRFRVSALCLSGGGARTLGFLGGLQVLESLSLLGELRRVAGSSMGALLAMMVALGYRIKEIREVSSENFSLYKDRTLLSGISSMLLGGVCGTRPGFGMHSGDRLVARLRGLIASKFGDTAPATGPADPATAGSAGPARDPTLKDLQDRFGKVLMVTGVNLDHRRVEYFGPETTPEVPIYLAVRISMSYPFLFDCVPHEGCLYVDGGLIDNFPLTTVSIPDETIGFNQFRPDPARREARICSSESGSGSGSGSGSASGPAPGPGESIRHVVTYLSVIRDLQARFTVQGPVADPDGSTIQANPLHLETMDFGVAPERKSDAMTIYKILTIRHLLSRVKFMKLP